MGQKKKKGRKKCHGAAWNKHVRLWEQTQNRVTTLTDVMILNYTVGLDVARGTQANTQSVWYCKLPIDSLPPTQVRKFALWLATYGSIHYILVLAGSESSFTESTE